MAFRAARSLRNKILENVETASEANYIHKVEMEWLKNYNQNAKRPIGKMTGVVGNDLVKKSKNDVETSNGYIRNLGVIITGSLIAGLPAMYVGKVTQEAILK